MSLSAFAGKLVEEGDGDVLRGGIHVLSQALMETEIVGLIGAERHERTTERGTYRNGYPVRTWDTRAGTIELAIPKLRAGTYFPSLLQPRRRAVHRWGKGAGGRLQSAQAASTVAVTRSPARREDPFQDYQCLTLSNQPLLVERRKW